MCVAGENFSTAAHSLESFVPLQVTSGSRSSSPKFSLHCIWPVVHGRPPLLIPDTALLPSQREALFMLTSVPVAERRPARRFSRNVPLRVRVWKSAVPEQKLECLNMSKRGVYFASGSRFKEGEQLELILRMPEEIVGQAKTNWRCLGRVVRTSALGSSAWALGVAVRFEHYQEVEGLPRHCDGKTLVGAG